MEHTKELISIGFTALAPSPFNVRRHSVGQIEKLAALIDSQGLLHNLAVTEQVIGRGKARTVKFAVADGERRRRALLLLPQRGRLPKGHEVLCGLVPTERAREVSLAENSGREPMHAADKFEAFKGLIDEGKGVEDVAARFGVSMRTVQRRLKLSALSPKLLALYRALTMNALPGAGTEASANDLAAILGTDTADWGEPAPEGYLKRVPKAQIIAALKKAGPDLSGGGVEAMKKDALVTAAVSRLAGKRWLPEPLRQSPG